MEDKIFSHSSFVGYGNDKQAVLFTVRGDFANGTVTFGITEKGALHQFKMESSDLGELMAAFNKVLMPDVEHLKIKGETPEGFVEIVGDWDADKQEYTPTFRRINDTVNESMGAEE